MCKHSGGAQCLGERTGAGGWSGGLPWAWAEKRADNLRESREICGCSAISVITGTCAVVMLLYQPRCIRVPLCDVTARPRPIMHALGGAWFRWPITMQFRWPMSDGFLSDPLDIVVWNPCLNGKQRRWRQDGGRVGSSNYLSIPNYPINFKSS